MIDASTTPDPVELWRRRVEAFSTRDFDAAMRLYAPDAVVDVNGQSASRVGGRAR